MSLWASVGGVGARRSACLTRVVVIDCCVTGGGHGVIMTWRERADNCALTFTHLHSPL